MPRMTSKPTNWSALLNAAAKRGTNQKPAGAKTLAEIMAETGFGHCKAYRLVNRLIKDGELTRTEGQELDTRSNHMTRRVWYTPTK